MNPLVDRAFQTHSFHAAAFQAPLENEGGSFLFDVFPYVDSWIPVPASDLKRAPVKERTRQKWPEQLKGELSDQSE